MKQRLATILIVLVSFAAALASATAQENPNVKWKLLTPALKGAPGEVVEVKVQAAIAPGSHMYTTKVYPDTMEGPQPTEVTVGEKGVLSMAGRLKGPKPIAHFDAQFETVTEYWEKTVTLTVPVRIAKTVKDGSVQGWVSFYFMTCDESSCMPGTDRKFTFTVEVAPKDTTAIDTAAPIAAVDTAKADTAAAIDTASTAAVDTGAAVPDKAAAPGATKEESADKGGDEIDAAISEGLWSFLLVALLAGLAALLTPCVYPMIPITVSFFSKREHESKAAMLRDATLYAVGIITTFVGLGFLISLVVGATGVTDFATDPYVNIIMAVIFAALALSLFGLFEIQVPTGLLNTLNKKSRGGGSASVIMMGLVFSLTSFACTVPFIASIFSKIETLPWYWPLIGTATFAAAFSLPFFLLAMFPSLLKSMPKSGGWLNAVKVVMGFIELAFAVKFIAGTDMAWELNIFTREVCVAIWIAVCVLACVYLLGRFQLSHDTPVDKVGPMRVLFATGFLAAAFWLLTGLFGGNLGELEAHIPPPRDDVASTVSVGGSAGASHSGESGWFKDDYGAALAEARKTGKPIFIDFTGYFCTNCRWMERNMFPKKEVAALMEKFILVRLYTDRRDSINRENRKLQMTRLNTFALPYYAIYTSEDKFLASASFTRSTDNFVAFLQKGLTGKAGPVAANLREHE